MADEQRPVSRRARRETGERQETPSERGGMAPEISAGLAYTSEIPTSKVAEAIQSIEIEQTQGLSRKDRRRIERLDSPMETWTAEEEARHTGTVPTMTPEAIAQQEALARQKAAAAQKDALTASGSIPLVSRSAGSPAPQGMDRPQQPPVPQPPVPQPPVPQPPVPQQPVPQQPVPQQPVPQQPVPQQPPQAIPPGNLRPVPIAPSPGPLVVPQLATTAPTVGISMSNIDGGTPPPTRPPQPGALGAPAVEFDALIGGGGAPPLGNPPLMPAPQSGGPFQPPGFAPQDGQMALPGQGMVVPGAGTIQTTTGTLRTIPGTGTIPRPVVEIQPAGGVRHFGWAQLGLLAAAAFALGVVIWNVAAHGS